MTGTVDASGGPAAVPTITPGALALGAAAMLGLGALALRRSAATTTG